MPKNGDLFLYCVLLALGVTGVVMIEIVPRYMLSTSLVYGGF